MRAPSTNSVRRLPAGRRELRLFLRHLLGDVRAFAEHGGGLRLRSYQQQVATAIVASVLRQKGLTFVVIFPRQSGKNEVQAQIEAYLLTLLMNSEAEIVKVSPTWKPQSLNAMHRLERILKRNLVTQKLWSKESGYIYRVGSARLTFLSGGPAANVVGATASTLLECDEAQDVLIEKWDREIAPMAASTNATRVFWGTAWTSQTLLAREMRLAQQQEQADGVRRVFVLSADGVRGEVPAYGQFVDGEIARLGRNHPMVRTQFFSEEIDGAVGMFPESRLALMQGSHAPQTGPLKGRVYAFLIDVGGERLYGGIDRSGGERDGGGGGEWMGETTAPAGREHDSTALTVVEIATEVAVMNEYAGNANDVTEDFSLHPVVYRVVYRRAWTGAQHALLYGALVALIGRWQPQRVVIDATGVGAGLASFLRRSLGAKRLIPFVFSTASKSKLGWDFLSIVETGRYREYDCGPSSPALLPGGEGSLLPLPIAAHYAAGEGRWVQRDGDEGVPSELQILQDRFWRECRMCAFDPLPGPEQRLRWGVPEGRRDPASGEVVHDDLLLSAALCAALEGEAWGAGESLVVKPRDPLEGLEF